LTGNFNELCTVVTNLVMNARDATLAMKQEDGRTPAIEIATSSTGEGYALLTVKDNGGGIPEDARERIFDPFYTTKEAGAGTGLGLSIVQGIVERHGGEIELTSSAEGAAFTVRLPLNPEG
jgi:two-component system NtrC family sensor kinase